MSYPGVYQIKNSSRWQASISVNDKQIFLGGYEGEAKAIIARKKAEKKYKKESLKAGELKIIKDRADKSIQNFLCTYKLKAKSYWR